MWFELVGLVVLCCLVLCLLFGVELCCLDVLVLYAVQFDSACYLYCFMLFGWVGYWCGLPCCVGFPITWF